MTNHVAKDCRSSEEKKRKYKESLKSKKQIQELQENDAHGFGSICHLGDEASARGVRSGTEEPPGSREGLCQLSNREKKVTSHCHVTETDIQTKFENMSTLEKK